MTAIQNEENGFGISLKDIARMRMNTISLLLGVLLGILVLVLGWKLNSMYYEIEDQPGNMETLKVFIKMSLSVVIPTVLFFGLIRETMRSRAIAKPYKKQKSN